MDLHSQQFQCKYTHHSDSLSSNSQGAGRWLQCWGNTANSSTHTEFSGSIYGLGCSLPPCCGRSQTSTILTMWSSSGRFTPEECKLSTSSSIQRVYRPSWNWIPWALTPQKPRLSLGQCLHSIQGLGSKVGQWSRSLLGPRIHESRIRSSWFRRGRCRGWIMININNHIK